MIRHEGPRLMYQRRGATDLLPVLLAASSTPSRTSKG